MIDIVVFGKPRAFESFEFEFEGKRLQFPENSHTEPSIRPKNFDEPIFHYFRKDGIACWEVYRRCRGFDNDRSGIVFGIGIKSDRDFGLADSLGSILMPYWEVFAQAFLDQNNKFQFESIVGFLKTTKWGTDDEEKVRSKFSNHTHQVGGLAESPLLLAVPDINELNSFENTIKEYTDVYLASRPDIFQDSINRDVLMKRANNVIHIINEGTIVKLDTESGGKEKEKEGNNRKWTWIWGGNNGVTGTSGSEKKDPKGKGIPSKHIAAIAVLLIIVGTLFFIFKSKPADRIVLAKAPESGCISDDFNLNPKLYHGNSGRTSTNLEDIDWKVEGEGKGFVEILVDDKKNVCVHFKDEYFKTKHTERSITVIASLNGKDLAVENNNYSLEKYMGRKANYVSLKRYDKPIENKFPDISSIIDTIAYFDGKTYDLNVSTIIDVSDFSITGQDSQYAEIKKDADGNLKLFVKGNRPSSENDVKITVVVNVEGKKSEKNYTIIKKKNSGTGSTDGGRPAEKGTIMCKRKAQQDEPYGQLPSSFRSDDIKNYHFIAMDRNGARIANGVWDCESKDIQFKHSDHQETSIKNSPPPGNYTIMYCVGSNIRAEVSITITE